MEKLHKQKMQSTTLMNSLQRENSAKDALIHQAKNEIEKLRKEMREKEITLSQMSAKVRGLWKNRILFWIILTREIKFCLSTNRKYL